ncbi:hypothetical protein AtEden1_Chr1g0059411 [Arabidopsis thaliana]
MSTFVTTARVRSPVLSTCLDILMDSQVVKSTVADRTLSCPFTGTRVIPGRSTIVISGTPAFFTWSVRGVSETPLPDPATQYSQVLIKIKTSTEAWKLKPNIFNSMEGIEAKHTSYHVCSCTNSLSNVFLICRNNFVTVLQPDLRFRASTSLEPHDKRNSSADSLPTWQTDSCQRLEDTRLPRGLVSNHNNGRKLNPFLHHIQVPELVHSVKQRPDVVIVR